MGLLGLSAVSVYRVDCLGKFEVFCFAYKLNRGKEVKKECCVCGRGVGGTFPFFVL